MEVDQAPERGIQIQHRRGKGEAAMEVYRAPKRGCQVHYRRGKVKAAVGDAQDNTEDGTRGEERRVGESRSEERRV